MKEYSDRFLSKDAVRNYEENEYSVDGYAMAIWEMQKPFLKQVLDNKTATHDQGRLLDFACGTGRVLSYVEKFYAHSDGLDISEAMIEIARTRCTTARLSVADICSQDVLNDKPYDVITCFRFLLNAETSLSSKVLLQLRERINNKNGLLIINLHGNRHSIRFFSLKWRRMMAKFYPEKHEQVMMADMGLSETRKLLLDAGFQVTQEAGFGVLPSFLYRSFVKPWALAIDRQLCRIGLFKEVSIDVVFVCVPIG